MTIEANMEGYIASTATIETTEKVIATLVNPITCLQDSSSEYRNKNTGL